MRATSFGARGTLGFHRGGRRGPRDRQGDLDRDRLVSVDDLYNYVYDRVKERAPSQTPSKKSELEGPIYLAKSAYRPEVKPARLDSDLLENRGSLRRHPTRSGSGARDVFTRPGGRPGGAARAVADDRR